MRKLLVCLVLAATIGVAYYNALGNDFVFDDYMLVAESPLVRSSRPLSQFLLSPTSLGYRPFRNLSYIVDVRIGGMQPWVLHLSNLFYHWLSACFVFFITFRLTNSRLGTSSQLMGVTPENEWRWRPAIFVAALWALHPVLTDAVTYISGRRDILGGLCVFFGFWTYLRFRASTISGSLKYGWLLLSCLAYGFGIMSKESAIVLPLLCWLYDVQHEGVVASLRRRWAVYFLVLLLGGAVLWHFSGAMILATIRYSVWYGGSLEGNFATVVRIWVHDLGLMVFPRTLLADYSYNAFPTSSSFAQPDVLFALAIIVSIAGGLTLLARRFPLCGYGGLWMLVSILPLSHIIPIKEIVAEHYLYVPLFGFCLIVGVLLDALCGVRLADDQQGGRLRTAAVYGLVLVLLTGAVLRTITRNRDWVNEETFWSVVTQTAPQSARGHYNLAGVYKRQNRFSDAAREFAETLALVPRHSGAIVGLGELAFESGHYGQAFQYASQAQQIAPQSPRVIYLLSWVNLALKNIDTAEQFFQQAAVLMPTSPGVYAGLEAVAKERGDKEAAARWADKRRMVEAKSGQMG
jgi:protein O-mannosyl-transferase